MKTLQKKDKWTPTRLKNVSEVNAQTLSATTGPNYVLRYLEISNVNSSGIISMSAIEEISYIDAPSRARRVVQSGDTVISSVRPNLQAVAHIDQASKNFIASTGFYVVSPNHKPLHPKYIYYLLLSEHSKQYLEAVSKGVGYPAVDDKDFVTLKFLLPSRTEQRRITAFFDKTCAVINSAIEAKRKQLDTLDALRKSIIHKTVTKGLDDSVELKDSGVEYLGTIPESWAVDRLKDIVTLRNIKTSEKSENEDYLELEDIEQGTGKIISKRNSLEVESSITLFNKGDVLFGKLRPYLEKYYLAEFDGKCTGEILAFNPVKINGRYLLYCFASPWFIGQCSMLAYGAKMPRVNWSTQLAQLDIPIPSKDEQVQIANYLDIRTIDILNLRENINNQITNLEEYRKSLINECVTGKRRIKDNDLKGVQVNV